MSMQFKNKTAVVLGASAEGGTGWAIAEGLAAEGANVVVAARTLPDLERLAARINGRAIQCDAASDSDIERLAEFAVAEFGKIDIAVNSAALPVTELISDISMEMVQKSLNVNYIGQVSFIKHMTRHMNDDSSLVIISSSSSQQPLLPHFAYACAKAATDCLVRYAALEYGPRRIRVNSILPGPIKSHMARDLYAIPGVEEAFCREVPLGRVGVPEDYANAVIWLSGPAYVTGLNIPVSGGNHLTRQPGLEELPLGKDSYGSDFS
jgi:NAD(P)-dependent dehydrogenase (short-subunit alcohol dehydrogenase family)